MDYDVIIIGSGFGGSVAALRLAQRGRRVAVLEQGRRITPDDMRAADESLRRLLWLPRLGMHGFFVQHIFRHVGIVGGVGVGGGSLVYAAVLLEPGRAFFEDPAWHNLAVDWAAELRPHYATARQMLGSAPNPHHGLMDDYLRQTASDLGAGHTFDTVPLGIYFSDRPGRKRLIPILLAAARPAAAAPAAAAASPAAPTGPKTAWTKTTSTWPSSLARPSCPSGRPPSSGRCPAVATKSRCAIRWSAGSGCSLCEHSRWWWPPGCWARCNYCFTAVTWPARCRPFRPAWGSRCAPTVKRW